MLCFPVPYPNELVYSFIARAGIRSAIKSPKQLLDQVYGDRKVIATIDLPSHLSAISRKLVNAGQYGTKQLIYDHTLFPIYAPFVHESIRQRAIDRMESQSKGTVHLMLGAPASIVKVSDKFRVCPKCENEQEKVHGESYWSRLWYLPSLPFCLKHGFLSQSLTSYHDNRHTYHACGRIKCNPYRYELTSAKTQQFYFFASKSEEIMHLPIQESPSQHQWSLFYNHLAHDFSCGKGSTQVAHDKIWDLVASKNVIPDLVIEFDSETNWLRAIFRRHRKSFSYLQHLTVWSAFIPDMSISEIIKEVKSKNKVKIAVARTFVKPIAKMIEDKRNKWMSLILATSVLKARNSKVGGGLYAWLYRNDKDWLLAINHANKLHPIPRQKKVNWKAKDRALTKQLIKVLAHLDTVMDGPRRTKNYLLKQLENYGTVSKQLNLLPRLSSALNHYQESVFEFQARRLTKTVIAHSQAGVGISRWKLMRSANLPKERILPIVDALLNWVVMERNFK